MDAREAPLPARIGRYRIERLLGRGAMGRVVLARDLVLDRDVAVKLLRDDLGLEPEQQRALVERMRHEAKACARVGHPNIVQLFDMGEEPSVGLYLVFEYASGTTLKDRLAQGQLQPGSAADVAREIGDALTTAHENGVLHRDVKPENIILTPKGSKIADFGIARVPNSTLTKNGGLLGTPAYSAPECIERGEFSAQSDQFSLAATLYEALSRRRAFPGEDAVTVAARITNDEPPSIADSLGLDPHVDGVLARGLAERSRPAFRQHARIRGCARRGARPPLARGAPDASRRAARSAPPRRAARRGTPAHGRRGRGRVTRHRGHSAHERAQGARARRPRRTDSSAHPSRRLALGRTRAERAPRARAERAPGLSERQRVREGSGIAGDSTFGSPRYPRPTRAR